ncbi:MAG: hypothetical protein PHQ66_00535 [Candidatus Nanoarchaeia archaeon]|nr:hypothetical protein [Candidatus Nanoarchaeia archaeon]MDD5358067.1 hypothetical protein [Candidatus Nanoarchaeia archaeon]MDD5589255.1 hypothetical protein [Candidatus Nanoarchaeia archaeon]
MKLVNFNFTKISVERFKDRADNIKFNTKMDISSIDILKNELLKTKDELIKVDFVYTLSFEPELAKIDFAGNFILSVDSKMAKDIIKGWKEKQTSDDFRTSIFNLILKKSNVKALELEEELGLPYHIPLPSLSPQKKTEEKESQ